jgi:organic radical activating enzyme
MGLLERLGLRGGEQAEPLAPGLFSYTAPASHPFHYRLHLRIEPGGDGLLVINASTVLHLNRTAAELAYHFIKLTPPDQVAEQIAKRYRTNKSRAAQDYADFAKTIQTLIETPDLDPITYLDLERATPYENLSAPYRLDAALTYALPEGAPADASPHKRVERELTTAEWKQVIDKAYAAGIPHIAFTGGEPTLRADLAELLQHAEDRGLVTGLITDGHKLADTRYLKTLLDAGLDHAMIILQPNKNQTWDSLASFAYWREVLNDDIFIAAHLTVNKDNEAQLGELVDKLAGSGIRALSLSAADPALSSRLQAARDRAAAKGLPLVWDLPVPYSAQNPVSLELEAESAPASGAGKAWLYVEPDGDVLPGQGVNKVLGNIARDEWDKIWGNG